MVLLTTHGFAVACQANIFAIAGGMVGMCAPTYDSMFIKENGTFFLITIRLKYYQKLCIILQTQSKAIKLRTGR